MCLAIDDACCLGPGGAGTSGKVTTGLPKRIAEDIKQALFVDVGGPPSADVRELQVGDMKGSAPVAHDGTGSTLRVL